MTTQIMVVEDHQMTLMGLKMLLEQSTDVELVAEASNGFDAVRKAAESHPEIILMDIGLPEMDGIEATQKIKAQFPSVKVVMLTSKDNETDVFAALAAGADAYCMKGISPETLLAVIQSVKDGAAWLDPAIAKMVLGRFVGKNVSQLVNTTPEQSQNTQNDCPLTPREMEVLQLIVDGHSNPDIAEALVITKATAKAHVHSILQKLCVDDRTQAAVLAMRQGYVKT